MQRLAFLNDFAKLVRFLQFRYRSKRINRTNFAGYANELERLEKYYMNPLGDLKRTPKPVTDRGEWSGILF
jgi:hypothetical protein